MSRKMLLYPSQSTLTERCVRKSRAGKVLTNVFFLLACSWNWNNSGFGLS